MKQKIIFLDIDGVLNSERWYKLYMVSSLKHNKDVHEDINPFAISNLNIVLDYTKAKIVMSSTWRFAFKNTCDKLYDSKLLENSIIDKIDGYEFDHENGRAQLIQNYIDEHKDEIDNYVILDSDFVPLKNQKQHFIKINKCTGLTGKNCLQIIAILEKQFSLNEILDSTKA